MKIWDKWSKLKKGFKIIQRHFIEKVTWFTTVENTEKFIWEPTGTNNSVFNRWYGHSCLRWKICNICPCWGWRFQGALQTLNHVNLTNCKYLPRKYHPYTVWFGPKYLPGQPINSIYPFSNSLWHSLYDEMYCSHTWRGRLDRQHLRIGACEVRESYLNRRYQRLSFL